MTIDQLNDAIFAERARRDIALSKVERRRDTFTGRVLSFLLQDERRIWNNYREAVDELWYRYGRSNPEKVNGSPQPVDKIDEPLAEGFIRVEDWRGPELDASTMAAKPEPGNTHFVADESCPIPLLQLERVPCAHCGELSGHSAGCPLRVSSVG